MKTGAIFNGKSSAAEGVSDEVQEVAERHAIPLVAVESGSDIKQAIRRFAEDGCERVIVAGGDGTVSAAVNALGSDSRHVSLGIVPLGTGNDFARSLGLSADDWQMAWQLAVEGPAIALDIGRVRTETGDSYFINAANGGWAGLVARDVEGQDKARWGSIAYWKTAVSKLVDMQEYRAELTLDGEVIALNAYGLTIANGRFVGGGFPVAPSALVDDGLLDITVIPVLTTLELLAAGVSFRLSNEQTASDPIKMYRARQVQLKSEPAIPFSIDGEVTQPLEATFEVVPRAIQVVVGDEAPAVAVGGAARALE